MKQLHTNMEKLFGSVFNTYDNGKELVDIRNILVSAAKKAFWEHAKKKYWVINFSSPAGEDSESLLTSLGILAIWDGVPGYRGDTTVFLSKDQFKNKPDLKKIIETMSRLDNRYDDLNYLFDEDSIIKIGD